MNKQQIKTRIISIVEWTAVWSYLIASIWLIAETR